MIFLRKYFSNQQLFKNVLIFTFLSSILFATLIYKGFEIFWILVLGINLFFWGVSIKTNKIKISYQGLIVLTFTLYLLLHYLILSKQNWLQITFWVFIGYILCFFYFKSLISENKKIINAFLNYVIAIAFIESCIASLQYLELINSNNNFFKLVGTFYSPNMLAFYLSLSSVIIVWKFLNLNLTKRSKVLHLGMLIYSVIIIIAITSRSSYIAFFIGIISLLIPNKKVIQKLNSFKNYKKIIAFVFLCFICIFSAQKLYQIKPDSANSRFFVAKKTIDLIKNKPLFGHGIFSFRGNYNIEKAKYFESTIRPWDEVKNGGYTYHVFNEFLYILYEIGLVGLVFVILIIALLFWKFKVNSSQSIALAILIMLFILSLFSYPIYVPHIAMIGIFAAAIISTQNDYRFFLSRNKFLLFLTKGMCIVIGLFLIYLSLYKINSRLDIKKYFNDPKYSSTLNKKELINLFKLSNDIGESDFYLGYQLFQKGYKAEGIKLMYDSFPITADPKMGKILAESLMQIKDYSRAKKIYEININNEPFRFEPRMNYGLLLKKCNRLYEQAKLLETVIDLPVKIASDKVDHYKKSALSFLNKYEKHIKTKPEISGSLSINKVIKSSILDKKIKYKIYLPAIEFITKPLPVVYFTDGQLFADNNYFINTIDHLIMEGKTDPIAMIFIDPREIGTNKNLRNEYYLCNQHYARFIVDELLPIIEKRSPVSDKAEQRSFWGQSFGGLFAMYLADSYPNHFKNIILQSPAFHPCPGIYTNFNTMPLRDFKIYMSYGTDISDTENQDLPMIEILKKKGYDLKVNRVVGGKHSQEEWMKQIEEIMIYIEENDK